ncbi:GIY-YIG nuclease family protein [Sphingomonas sp. ASY06-1R]|uniref:GIY-YIG nuclease family protein n=1 Tax=Sphingomonas sp. ASY06-1R TaxID=3445771 RepID=UPI003FA34174
MTFWTYMLRCADERFYVGHTDNLEGRMSQHQHGGYCDFTARRRPVSLAWSQDFATREEALSAERQLKGWTRAKKMALIEGDWARISWLAVPPKERPSTSLRTNGAGKIHPKPEPGREL